MSREQHLMPFAERAERVQEKRRAALRFLRSEIWTDHKNLGELLGVMPAATYRTVSSLIKAELVRTERVALVGGHITLIGITHHGQALATDSLLSSTLPARKWLISLETGVQSQTTKRVW